jgi:hypothetical protein
MTASKTQSQNISPGSYDYLAALDARRERRMRWLGGLTMSFAAISLLAVPLLAGSGAVAAGICLCVGMSVAMIGLGALGAVYYDGPVKKEYRQIRKLTAGKKTLSALAKPKIGGKTRDGTIYAGISPDTGRPMYTTPRDARFSPLRRDADQDEAADYAKNLDAHGHKDWRMPTLGELRVLFNNRAAIGRFKDSNACPDGWYRTSTPGGADTSVATVIKFGSGRCTSTGRKGAARLRCVRG